MKNHSIKLVLLFLSLYSFNLLAESSAIVITAEQWAIPRHGERMLKLPEMKQLVSQWQQNTQQIIEISYPGGENGELWLRELKDWLIALGIASAKIKSIAGSGSKDIIKLTVI
ncbi:MAG: hypothetical protein KAU21_13655 [Gammaproteobacteria bacterium]|nr:hypothetical protein [Gammaproteobacteria bacterium]